MPTFTSPVTLAQFQTYLKDASTDPTLTGFYQTLLDTATEYAYNWLDRDYTPNATKTDTFWGDDSQRHDTHDPVGTLLTWTYSDQSGTTTNPGTSDMLVRWNGHAILLKTLTFVSGAEHKITFQLPSTLTCPETVKQVITEFAALLFEGSNQGAGALGILSDASHDASSTDRERFLDLSERHKEMLRPYKRYPV